MRSFITQDGIKHDDLPEAFVKIRGYLDQQIYIDKTFAEFDADGSGCVMSYSSYLSIFCDNHLFIQSS